MDCVLVMVLIRLRQYILRVAPFVYILLCIRPRDSNWRCWKRRDHAIGSVVRDEWDFDC